MTSIVGRFFIVGIFAFCAAGMGVVAAPEVIETYGDSISAGFLSATAHNDHVPLFEVSRIWTDLASYVATGDVAKYEKLHAPDLAWPNQLKAAWGAKYLLNRAITGAVAADMAQQIAKTPKIKKDVSVGAFIFIGHNDICKSQVDEEDFEKQYYDEMQAAITAWDTKHDGATLYLLPTGEIDRIYKTLEGSVWHRSNKVTLTCNDTWERFFPFCAENNKRRKDGTLSDYLISRGKIVRKVLKRLAIDWNRDTKQKNQFMFLADLLSGEYQRDYFAVDCYHLSEKGQKVLAGDVLKKIQQ